MEQITWNDFEKIELRVGTITEFRIFLKHANRRTS
jgi:hypothetical protein